MTVAAAAIMTPSSKQRPGDAKLWEKCWDAVIVAVVVVVAITTTVAMQPSAMVAPTLAIANEQ